MPDDDLLRLARQSAETDLPFLLRAKEEAKKRMKDNPTPENVGGFRRAREELEGELARRQGQTSIRVYKTQLDAVAYLKDAGYKCSKSQFNRDVKARKVPRTPEGWFDETALLGYANANLTPAGQVADRQLATAESPSQRASITVQDLFVDEEDIYSRSGDSSPLEDFKGRTRSYGDFAKIIRACQPKGDESSSIWTGITRQVDQLMCYEVVCPACRHQHLMDVDRIVVPDGETDPRLIRSRKLARYRCPHCRYLWSDHARDLAVASGRWRPYVWTGAAFEPGPDVRDARSIGFHLPAVLSRFVSLSDLAARRILAGSDDPAQQRQYHNDDLGMPWSPVELQTDVDRLLELRDPHLPPRTVPHGAVALTCGIDVQKRGFWYLVRAWMPTMASYVIDYGYLGSWDDVQALVFDTYYPVQGPDGSDVGERMPIWRACIDSGGTETEGVYTRTEEVYMWVRANGCGVVHACKGASRPQAAPVRWVVRERMPHNGRPIPGGLRLYLIDSGAFKTTDMGRLLNQDSRQPLRFHAGADETLASQLSAERMVRKNGNLVWVRERKDNHLLDCLVLSAAAADASWTPSLPHYILQLQAQARMQNETPRPRAKKRPQPEAAGHRW